MDQTSPIKARIALLSTVPCFSKFQSDELQLFASLFTEVRFKPGDIIVTENEVVDNIMVIEQGQAEVTQLVPVKRRLRKKPKMTSVPIALLYPNDTIGLNDTGFFSTTGMRTATVTAVTEMTVLLLNINQLHAFLQERPHLYTALSTSAEQMLRMQLIKHSLPFSPLSPERVQWLVAHIETRKVPAGSIIFHQGEDGDYCYLIQSGQVEITVDEPGMPNHTLSLLKPPMLFGEAMFITHSKRNATARAMTDCVLLALKYEYLGELIESEGAIADMFMMLMVDRSRPERNPAILAYHRTMETGQKIVILKNPDNGKYFKLAKDGWFIWKHLNGKLTLQEITFALAEKLNTFEPDRIAALILKLANGGFINNLKIEVEHGSHLPLWVRGMQRIKSVLEARVAIRNADKWINKIYHKVAYLLFTRLGKCLLALLAISGFVSFVLLTHQVVALFQTVHASKLLFVLVLPFMVFSVALHELGHAFMTKSYGYEVNYLGIGWYWLGPIAFTDTSDMWLGKRWPRIMVNAAGMFSDMVTAGVSALLGCVIPNSYLQCFLWIFAFYTYVNAFRMLSPLQELDGYYILMDLFDRPRLRQSAVIWLVKEFPHALRHPRLFRKNKAEAYYWLACFIYLIAVSMLTLWMQGFVFKVLKIPFQNSPVSLVLPFLVIIISSLGIWAEIRSQKA